MLIELTISDNDKKTTVAGVIDDEMLITFQPVKKSCKPSYLGEILNEEYICSPQRKFREYAANVLAKELSEYIIEIMEQNDTLNGYTKCT